MNVRSAAAAMSADLVALRRELHRDPEIGLHLPRTQERILAALAGLPLEVRTGRALSSVTAVLRGRVRGPVVLLRADMDALPVAERSGVPYASRREGAMHACGHDLHVAAVVGAARLLAARRAELAGDVVLMFQPGEEGHDGAARMIDEGVLTAAGRRADAAYALHVLSAPLPSGMFAARPGPMMAACDGLFVRVLGAGGHGARPHEARDPVPATCYMITSLHSLLTRTDPFDPAVITVGSLHAGSARNIIPAEGTFEATIRTFTPTARERVRDGVLRLCHGIADAHGLDVDVRYEAEYPVTVNDEAEYEFLAGTVREVFGADRFVRMRNPVTASEDFARVLAEVPGAFVFLGAGPGPDPATAPGVHSPLATFDDSVIADGAALLAELALRRLA